MIELKKLNFEKLNGLIPAVIVDINTGSILMLGFMNEEALRISVETTKVTFYSRAKKRLWTKGETSGNFIIIKEIIPDCDFDSIVIRVEPMGPVCHSGDYSCFDICNNNIPFLSSLEVLIRKRKKELPLDSYTSGLFRSGTDRIIRKVGEEAAEVIIAAKNSSKEEIIAETADLLFHLQIMLVDQNIYLDEIVSELVKRNGGR